MTIVTTHYRYKRPPLQSRRQSRFEAQRMIPRRRMLAAFVFSVLSTLPPGLARSQGYVSALLSKVPWPRIVEGIAAGLNLLDALQRFFAGSDNPSPICRVSLSEIDVLSFRIQALALALEARNFEAVMEGGDQGALPALIAYKREPDDRHWHQARNELAGLIVDAEAFLEDVQRIAGPGMEWPKDHAPAEDLQKVALALRSIRPSLEIFTITWGGSA
jgi:hypothetical protein